MINNEKLISEMVTNQLAQQSALATNYLKDFNDWYSTLSFFQKILFKLNIKKYTPKQTNITINVPSFKEFKL